MLFDLLAARGRGVRAAVVAACGLVLAALTVVTWYGWLGWDEEYQIDPVTAVASGPYEAWQVIGCALTLIGLALAAGILVHPLLPLLVMPLAFTVAWSLDAASKDDTGLWGVGAIMVLFGTSAGATAATAIATGVRRALTRRTGVR
jgi:hypothetical protein